MKPVINRKGSVTVEAAIFLPLFILSILALGCYIKLFGIMENVSYTVMDEASELAAAAYVSDTAPLFRLQLKERITEDTPGVSDVRISSFRYLYDDGDLNDMIYVSSDYSINVKLPVFGHTADMSSAVKCRGFTGVRNTGTPMSFDEMELEGIWHPVYVFPDSGEKFHKKDCTYVYANTEELVLTDSIRKKYDPCSACSAEDAPLGTYVYCFPENGYVYHVESCRQVSRYAVEMNKEEAVRKGYDPCSKCGGG